MPFSERHQRQRAKNWVLLGLLSAFALLFFVITLVKLKA